LKNFGIKYKSSIQVNKIIKRVFFVKKYLVMKVFLKTPADLQPQGYFCCFLLSSVLNISYLILLLLFRTCAE